MRHVSRFIPHVSHLAKDIVLTSETIHTYDAIAPAFAGRWFDLRLTDDMARFAGRLAPGSRVLDAGCGPGRDTLWLTEQGFQAVGIDLSMGMLQEGLARGVPAPLIQADMAHLPFRKGSFKGLWVCASLLHIPKAQAGDVLKELSRVVYPGHIYLGVKCGDGEEWAEDEGGRRRFVAYYQPAEIQLLMERCGFEVLDTWESDDTLGRRHPWISVLAWSRMTTPKTGCNVVVQNERGEVLLTRRADNGYWCLPGGHVDFGETVRECALREAYEETGLHVELVRLTGVYSRPYEKKEGLPRPSHYVILTFLARPIGGAAAGGDKPHLSDETTEVGYFPPDALPEPLWSWHRERLVDALSGRTEPYVK